MILTLQDDAKLLIKNVIDLAYFMRGGMSYETILLTMSFAERQLVSDFLKERLDQESKSSQRVY